jgi:hypothetical protein
MILPVVPAPIAKAEAGPRRARPGGRGRNAAARIDVILDITAKVPHVLQSFTGVRDEAGQALDRAALFLRQHVRG